MQQYPHFPHTLSWSGATISLHSFQLICLPNSDEECENLIFKHRLHKIQITMVKHPVARHLLANITDVPSYMQHCLKNSS
jgi:hypothetical protein